MANNTISVNVAPINATVVEDNVNVVVENKEETTMTTTTNGYMGTVIGMAVEDLKKLSLKDLKTAAQAIYLKGRSKMNKAELIEALTPYCDPTKKVEIIEKTEVETILDAMATPVETTVVEERKEEVTEMKKELTPVTVDTVNALAVLAHSYDPFTAYIDNGRQKDSADRANAQIKASWNAICEACGINIWIGNEDWSNARPENAKKAIAKYLGVELPEVKEVEAVKENTNENKEVSMKREMYMNTKWDKLVKAVAAEYVKQSLGVKWALFYKNTKATATNAEYLVKTNKLWGATSKVIKAMYGEKHCNQDTIQQTLNAMVVRGYLDFHKVPGKNGMNVIFTASADQMNAMWKLSK